MHTVSPENAENRTQDADSAVREPEAEQPATNRQSQREIGGRPGPDPTRYGDWEKNGRCIDF